MISLIYKNKLKEHIAKVKNEKNIKINNTFRD